jgi:hypothetical protein
VVKIVLDAPITVGALCMSVRFTLTLCCFNVSIQNKAKDARPCFGPTNSSLRVIVEEVDLAEFG